MEIRSSPCHRATDRCFEEEKLLLLPEPDGGCKFHTFLAGSTLAALCRQWLLLPPIVSGVELSEWLHAQAKNSADPRVLAPYPACWLLSCLGLGKGLGKGVSCKIS